MKYLIALVACLPLVALPQTAGPQPFTDRDVACLAKVIYFEERGESLAEQKAVAEVVLNRVAHRDFPDSICAVVHQRGQFPWAARVPRVREQEAYDRARDLSFRLLAGYEPRTDRRSLYFNAGWKPRWARKKVCATRRIGKNLFLW